MAKKTTPIITHTEVLCLAILAVSHKLHEYDEFVDSCDTPAARERATELRDNHAAIYAPKLEALKSLYKIETGTDFV